VHDADYDEDGAELVSSFTASTSRKVITYGSVPRRLSVMACHRSPLVPVTAGAFYRSREVISLDELEKHLLENVVGVCRIAHATADEVPKLGALTQDGRGDPDRGYRGRQ
jgi:hypothetical protein